MDNYNNTSQSQVSSGANNTNDQSVYNDPSFNNIGKGYYSDHHDDQDNNPYRSTASSSQSQNQNYNNSSYNGSQNQSYYNGNNNQNYNNGNANYNNGNSNYNNGNPYYNNSNPNYNNGNQNYNQNYNNGNRPYANSANAHNFSTYLVLSVVVAVLGSRIIGVIAIILTCLGNNDFKAGNIESYKDKYKVALILIIVGAVIGVFTFFGYTLYHITNALDFFNYL